MGGQLRLAIQSLLRTPGFTLTAILTLGLGIGLATAVFTVADALLLRRLPVRDQDRIAVLWGEGRDRAFPYPLGYDDVREFARRTRTLEQTAWFVYEGTWQTAFRDGDQVSLLSTALVSGDFFDVLGARALLGRTLGARDDVRGAVPVLVLSYGAWQRRFGGDPHVLGRRVVRYADSLVYTIVGVMPQGLDYPRGVDAWRAIMPSTPPGSLQALYVIGRLAPGAIARNPQDEMTVFFRRAEAASWQRDWHGVVHTLPRLIVGEVRPALFVFAAAAALLLLITCVNVANLLLVRGIARVREIAVRSALGAGRGRLIVHLLSENVLLAVAGGALGLAVAGLAVRLFVAFAPAGLPRLDEIRVNTAALAGGVAITTLAVLIFALAPAVITSRVELERVLRSDTRQSASRGSRLATEALVAGQVALALLVLSAAGLITRSLVKLERAELSFDPSRLLIGELTLRYDQYAPAKQLLLLERLLPQLRATPGVRAVTPVVASPFSGLMGWDGKFATDGQSNEAAAASAMLNIELVAPGYFETLGIPVLRGRAFTDADREGAPLVVVVSQSAARYYWGTDDPIGKRLRMGEGWARTATVVGVVPDTRYRDLRTARASVYHPLRQSFFPYGPLELAIRTSGPPADLVPTIRRVISETAPGVALVSAAPFRTFLQGPLAQPRMNAFLLAVFACSAVALAAVGLFGIMATLVRQRTREIGVRMALGATTRDVRRLVMKRGLAIAGVGAVLGLLGALLANRLLVAVLYEVSPTDGVTLTLVTGSLLGVAAVASLIPARSSTRIDPMVALRAE